MWPKNLGHVWKVLDEYLAQEFIKVLPAMYYSAICIPPDYKCKFNGVRDNARNLARRTSPPLQCYGYELYPGRFIIAMMDPMKHLMPHDNQPRFPMPAVRVQDHNPASLS